MNERKTKAEIKSDQDRINELDVKLQNRCGRSQEKSFLFEVNMSKIITLSKILGKDEILDLNI